MATNPISFRTFSRKTLSAVEVRPDKSNQHEFNGIQPLKRIFGETRFKREAIFSVEGDVSEYQSVITWYDAREAHPDRTEHRMYFQTNPVMAQASVGDDIDIGYDHNGVIRCVLRKKGAHGHSGNQLSWLQP